MALFSPQEEKAHSSSSQPCTEQELPVSSPVECSHSQHSSALHGCSTPRDTWHCCCAPRGPVSTALLLDGCCSPREEAGRISAMAAVLDVMGRAKSRSPWNAAVEESRNFGSPTSTPSPSCQVSLQREHLSSIICTLEEAQTYRQQ